MPLDYWGPEYMTRSSTLPIVRPGTSYLRLKRRHSEYDVMSMILPELQCTPGVRGAQRRAEGQQVEGRTCCRRCLCAGQGWMCGALW